MHNFFDAIQKSRIRQILENCTYSVRISYHTLPSAFQISHWLHVIHWVYTHKIHQHRFQIESTNLFETPFSVCIKYVQQIVFSLRGHYLNGYGTDTTIYTSTFGIQLKINKFVN